MNRAEIDGGYASYDAHPVEVPDEWGDLATWRGGCGRVVRPLPGQG